MVLSLQVIQPKEMNLLIKLTLFKKFRNKNKLILNK